MGTYTELKQKKEKTKKDLEKKKALLELSKNYAKNKKAGNVWILVALLLVLAEIVILSMNSTLGFSFSYVDLLIIGVPLVVGIVKKKNGKAAYKKAKEELDGVDINKLPQEIKKLEEKLMDLELEIEIEEDAVKENYSTSSYTASKSVASSSDKGWMRTYCGKNWDMKTFTATPENVRQLEIDAENLLVSTQHIAGSAKIIDNWLCNNRMELFTARLRQDSALEEALDRGFYEMGKSGSWKLKTLQYVISSFDLAILDAGMGGGVLMSFKELTDRAEGYRGPETEDEKEFFNAAMIGSITINSSVKQALSQF